MRISISPNSDNIQGRTAEKTMALQNRRRMKGLPPNMRLPQASVRVLQVFEHADALRKTRGIPRPRRTLKVRLIPRDLRRLELEFLRERQNRGDEMRVHRCKYSM